jgi:Domain of unknown function (DUF4397)
VSLRRILALFAAIAALLGFGACLAAPDASAAAESATGWVRCANLSPGNPAVDIYLIAFGNSGQPMVLRHVSYGDVSSYMAVSAGQYTVAMRPVGAPASSPPVVSTNFMVSAGTSYTVAKLGPAAAQRIEVLRDQMAAPKGSALVRVIQASLKQDQVTVSYGGGVLAQQLTFGAVTSYMSVQPGTQTVQFTASGAQTSMSVILAAGSVHTIVVLDSSSGLKVDNLTDAAGSSDAPMGGAATGFGGMASRDPPGSAPWLATFAAGLVLIAVGVLGLRRSRRIVVVRKLAIRSKPASEQSRRGDAIPTSEAERRLRPKYATLSYALLRRSAYRVGLRCQVGRSSGAAQTCKPAEPQTAGHTSEDSPR